METLTKLIIALMSVSFFAFLELILIFVLSYYLLKKRTGVGEENE